MVLALFRVNVENLPFPLREAGTVMQHCAILRAAAAMAETLKVFLLLAFPMDALKFPRVPIVESSTISTEADCSYVPVTLMTDSFMYFLNSSGVGILQLVFSIFLQFSWFGLMSCRSKHLLVFLLEAQRHLAFSSCLQPLSSSSRYTNRCFPCLMTGIPPCLAL